MRIEIRNLYCFVLSKEINIRFYEYVQMMEYLRGVLSMSGTSIIDKVSLLYNENRNRLHIP